MNKGWLSPAPQAAGNRALVLGIGILFWGFQTAAIGAERSDDPFSLSLGELVSMPVTSSTKTTKVLKTAPSSVTLFNREQITNLGANYLFELLNYVPGFQIYRQGESSNQYFHSVRGHRSSTKSREVLILIDGERINREFDNANAVPMIPLHNVAKIEFIRGPGSALYGSNAFLGVIDITTVKHVNQLEVEAGSHDKKRVAGLGYLAIGNWAIDIAAHAYDEQGETLELENTSAASAQKVRADDPRSGEDVRLTVQNEHTLIGASYYRREAEEFYITERFDKDYNYARDSLSSVRVKHRLDWNDTLKTEFGVRYSEAEYLPKTNFGSFLGKGDSSQDEKNTELQLHNDWAGLEQLNLQFGLEYRHSDFSKFELISENQGYYQLYPEKSQELYSVYLQGQWAYADGAELVVGTRYDRYDDAGTAFSPRLGWVNPINDNQTFKVLYGEAFRAPTVNELYLHFITIDGNPNLDPETIKTWEAIWLGQWERFNISINGFYNVMKNTIVRDEAIPDPAPNFYNASSEESFYGFEVEYGLQITDRLLLTANASNFHNLPDYDYRQSDWLGSTILNYAFDRWNFNLSLTYADEREMQTTAGKKRLDDYWVVSSKIRYFASDTINLYITANNLLDEEYETPTSRPSTLDDPIPNRGRELAVGIDVRFK